MSAYTPGPWLMAAIPSSIVGWPIVAPHASGRVVAKLCYADPKAFGGKMPGDGKFNLESKANGLLIAAAPGLFEGLERAFIFICNNMPLGPTNNRTEAGKLIDSLRVPLASARLDEEQVSA